MATATTIGTNTTWEGLGFSAARLRANLEALASRDAALAARLADAGPHDGIAVQPSEDGTPLVTRTLGRDRRRVEETADELAGVRADRSTLLLGLGTGERADALLRTLPGGATLWVAESDPGLVALAFARHDWSTVLAAGRLRLLLGADVHGATIPDDVDVLRHPRLDVARLAARMNRTRTPLEPAARAAVLRGELLQEELADALERAGRDVMILERGTATLETLAAELARLDAPLAASINFEPELAEICGRLGVDYAAWEIDPTASALPRASARAAEYTHVFTWRARRVAEFEAAGWRRAEFLPIGADPVRRRPCEEEPTDAFVFVGSCMLAPARAHAELLARAIAADRDPDRGGRWSSFLDAIGRLEADVGRDPCRVDVPETIEAELADRGLPRFLPVDGDRADVRVLAGERLAARKRIAVAHAVEDLGLRVWGEAGWGAVLGPGVYQGPAGHGGELTRLLATSAISLDLNRVYQPDIVTLRVFETGACGGFVLSEESEALRGLFDVDEVATWSSIEELRDAVAHFRAHPDERDAFAARLHARVLREHTVGHRVAHVLETVERRRGER